MAAIVETKRDDQTGLFGSPIQADPPPATVQPSIESTSLNRQHDSPGRVFSPAYPVTLARMLAGYAIASFIPTVKATFSIAKCCTLAAREEFHRYLNEDGIGYYPWEACSFNLDVEYSNSIVLPSIQRNMAWAMDNCRGTQLSSLEQWLVPLSTYVSPYIGVILLCPVGGIPAWKPDTPGRLQIFYTVCYAVLRPLPEYIRLLGDPASALFGAWHEVCSDAKTLAKLTPEKRPTMAERASWITAFAGDIEFSENVSWRPKVLEAINGPNQMGGASSQEDHILPVKGPGPSSEQLTRLLSSAHELEQVDRAIEIVITARKGFISGILIPVLLLLAVTAATFYDAYTMRGDKDTALALAYCTWYSWILILGMVGNCYASALSPAVAKKAFNRVLDFGEDPLSVPLGYRYVNGHLWQAWADSPSTQLNCRQAREDLKHNRGFWFRFCIGQFLGFCGVAFSTSCAIAIAWTTPTTGLGCSLPARPVLLGRASFENTTATLPKTNCPAPI
ncbi:hypothetical protein S40285_08882, partial [Stachybotrys chlorohalonatus IBT 40285]